MLRAASVLVSWWSFCACIALTAIPARGDGQDETFTLGQLFENDNDLTRYVAPFIELTPDEEDRFLLPGAPTPVRDVIGNIIGTKEVLKTVPKFKLIQCVNDDSCPASFPFCGKVTREQLFDPYKWVEGLRACFQCTDEDTSLCGGTTPGGY